MNVKLNKELIEVEDKTLCLDDFLKIYAPSSATFISKVNGKIISMGKRKELILNEGDEVVLIPVLSGG